MSQFGQLIKGWALQIGERILGNQFFWIVAVRSADVIGAPRSRQRAYHFARSEQHCKLGEEESWQSRPRNRHRQYQVPRRLMSHPQNSMIYSLKRHK